MSIFLHAEKTAGTAAGTSTAAGDGTSTAAGDGTSTAAGAAPAPKTDGASPLIRKRFSFEGRVQGVGFRYTTQRVCEGMGLTGWVKNEMDGTVTAEIQGSSVRVNSVYAQILAAYKNWPIQASIASETTLEPVPDENSFSVRYW